MKWWKRKKDRKGTRARYAPLRFERVGDPTTSREWVAGGGSGPLAWTARMVRVSEGVRWSLVIEGTFTGTRAFDGVAANPYAATTACNSTLRNAVDDHNRFAGL